MKNKVLNWVHEKSYRVMPGLLCLAALGWHGVRCPLIQDMLGLQNTYLEARIGAVKSELKAEYEQQEHKEPAQKDPAAPKTPDLADTPPDKPDSDTSPAEDPDSTSGSTYALSFRMAYSGRIYLVPAGVGNLYGETSKISTIAFVKPDSLNTPLSEAGDAVFASVSLKDCLTEKDGQKVIAVEDAILQKIYTEKVAILLGDYAAAAASAGETKLTISQAYGCGEKPLVLNLGGYRGEEPVWFYFKDLEKNVNLRTETSLPALEDSFSPYGSTDNHLISQPQRYNGCSTDFDSSGSGSVTIKIGVSYLEDESFTLNYEGGQPGQTDNQP